VSILQITKKEELYLQDALSHEKMCIMKYNNYAQQVQDTELAKMFQDIAQREQQHADTITQILQQAGIKTSN